MGTKEIESKPMEEMIPSKPAIVYREVVTATKDCLIITKTPDRIVPIVDPINMIEIKSELERSLNALKQWQDKVAGLQAIVDKYEANYVPEKEEEIITEPK